MSARSSGRVRRRRAADVDRRLHGARRSGRPTFAVVLAAALAACASLAEPRCAANERSAVQDSLFFGTGRANGVVSAEEWSAFLDATVTPRFPQGLTVSQASGQWRGRDGAIVREATYVLHVLHASDAASEASVAAIAAAYKSQFGQEAVLRVRARACMSF